MEKLQEQNALEESIKRIIKGQGFTADKNVCAKLSEFASKYLLDLLQEAKHYSKYTEKDTIQMEDVNLVIRKNQEKFCRINQIELDNLARQRNRTKLSNISDNQIKLPNAEFCLLKSNKNIIILNEEEDNITKKVKN